MVYMATKKPLVKKWWHSKTLWLNLLLTAAGVATYLTDVLPEKYAFGALVVAGIVNVILRVWYTETALE